ncbi:hypothetical protein AVDCRST_MAG81-1448 [uncultured Synechococcales cyanobacterium]|uniref:Uncharacterized protein n=1 Tax=uncultured Synechococcales cyanobacterium TaxID=1936017 RepID=A0A6J4V6I6_9CYAN|nr:hypothetical protein AVDCRST_MAG81-1448 [uncultured Synechococcales cyanobacterium]
MKTRKTALQLKEDEFKQKLRHRRIMRQELSLLFGSLFLLVLAFCVGLSVGAVAGFNGADGVICTQGNVPCKLLRLRTPKMILPEEK